MFAFSKRGRYRNDVLGWLYGLLYFYPRGRDNILKDYPGIEETIKSDFAQSAPHQRSAIFIASAVLADVVETLSTEQRSTIASQMRQMDMRQIKAAIGDAMASRPLPEGLFFGTIFFGNAIMIASTMLKDKEIEKSTFDMLSSELFGALDGATAEQRASERIAETLDEIMPENVLRDGDDGRVFSLPRTSSELPELAGTEVKVHLKRSAMGISLIRADNGEQITERRSLSQDDLEKIRQGLDPYRFVNLRAASGDIYSCIIAGHDSEVFGSMRAFWWALARVNVVNTQAKLSVTRLTRTSLANLHSSARHAWDSAIEEARSIDDMRDLIMPLRNVHFEVINEMQQRATSESERLGIAVALAMVLATQSEDRMLEGFAFRAFKDVLWQPGEEPREFYEHVAA